ncbi:MAG: hypothetical protein NTY31_03625 [Candidatus Falkowbacteria bacterium]|nr:hypothetical protein [Candidatus Falkowbacteria bacterium]
MEKEKNLTIKILLCLQAIFLTIKKIFSLQVVALTVMFGICLLAGILQGLVGNVVISLFYGVYARCVLFDKKGTVLKKRLQFFSFLVVLEAATWLCLTVFSADAELFGSTFIIIGLIVSTICFLIGWIFDKFMDWCWG